MSNFQTNKSPQSKLTSPEKNKAIANNKHNLQQKSVVSKPPLVSKIFKDVSFCFPHLDAILSTKLVALLKQQILANGGQVFQEGRLWLTKYRYYLLSQKASLSKLKKFQKELDDFLLHYSYVNKCITAGTLLTTDKFRISAPLNQSLKPQLEDQLSSIKQEKRDNQQVMKHNKTKLEEKELKKKESQQKKQRNLDLPGQSSEVAKKTQQNPNVNQQRSDSSSKTIPIEEQNDHQDQQLKLKRPRQNQNDKEVQEKIKPRKVQKKSQQQSQSKQKKEISPSKHIYDDENDHGVEKQHTQKKYWDDKKQEFVQRKVPGLAMPLNSFICEQLAKLQKIYQVEKDKGRAIAYGKAIGAIKSLKTQIKDRSDITDLKGIGPKIMDKIMELIETGKMNKLEKFHKDVKYQAIQKLCEVWGIGPATASQLYSKGIKTIEDLKKNQDLLTKNQRIGLKYFQELKQKIPRSQVQKIQKIVKETVYNLAGSPDIHIVETCGSYRRGKDFCGDIDIIITRKDGKFQKDLIFKLYEKLMQIGLITDHLSLPRLQHQHEGFSYMGVCRLEGGLHRRLDIKYYPLEQFAYALMHFTGSDMFNRSIRIVAHEKGYKLSDHSLTPLDSADEKGKGKPKKNVVCYSEEDIFKFLGLQYKAPKDRVA